MRVTSDVMVTTRKGRKIKLRNYPVREGKVEWFKNVSYRSDGYVQGVNLAATIAEDSDDPWWLISNLKTAPSTIGRYALRFQIEEWFKDLKHQLRIANQQTKSMKRIRRLLLVSCIANGFLLLTGKLAKRFPTWYDWLITGRQRSASIVWLAIQLIKGNLAPGWFWKRVWAQACLRRQALIRAGP